MLGIPGSPVCLLNEAGRLREPGQGCSSQRLGGPGNPWGGGRADVPPCPQARSPRTSCRRPRCTSSTWTPATAAAGTTGPLPRPSCARGTRRAASTAARCVVLAQPRGLQRPRRTASASLPRPGRGRERHRAPRVQLGWGNGHGWETVSFALSPWTSISSIGLTSGMEPGLLRIRVQRKLLCFACAARQDGRPRAGGSVAFLQEGS